MSQHTDKESISMEDGWISVDCGKPPTAELVLVTVKTPEGEKLDTAFPEYFYDTGIWDWNCRNHPDTSIVAWQSLPKPYRSNPEELARKAREKKIACLQRRLDMMKEEIDMFADDCEQLLDDILALNDPQLESAQWEQCVTDLKILLGKLYEYQAERD